MQKRKEKGKKRSKKPSLTKVYISIVVLVILVAAVLIFTNTDFSPKKESKKSTQTERTDSTDIKEFEYVANTKLNLVKDELTKTTNTYKFLVSDINTSEEYTWKALNIDTTLTSSWERLGYIYAHLHGDQAIKRYKSYSSRGDSINGIEAWNESVEYFIKANLYYNLALKYGTTDSAGIYYQMAQAAEHQDQYGQAIVLFQKAMDLEPKNGKYEAAMIRVLLFSGRFDQALLMNQNYMKKYPESDVPYLNLGIYYYNLGDTLQAIDNYEKAVLKGTKPEVGRFLYQYFTMHGNNIKADYYIQKARQAETEFDPEKF